MQIITETITKASLRSIASNLFGDMIKAVVDINKGVIAIDAELHSDLEALLINGGSKQSDLWGINFYPEMQADQFIEFDSMINMRPSQGNRSRGVEDEHLRQRIIAVVTQWITE